MLRSADLAAWLAGQLATLDPAESAPVKTGPLSGLTEEPDRIVTVVREGGRAPDDEGILYTVAFRLEVRGAQRDHDDAEVLADEVDDALLDAACPLLMGQWKVLAIAGVARPTLVGIDTAERSTLWSSYEVQVPATGIL